MRLAHVLLILSLVSAVCTAPAAGSVTALDQEIRYQFPRGNWNRLRFDDGEAEFVVEANKNVAVLSLKENCRAGTQKFFSDFKEAYRRGLVLDDPTVIRPDSVLVEEAKEGAIRTERYDRKSRYARFLRTTESRFSILMKSPVVKCAAVKK